MQSRNLVQDRNASPYTVISVHLQLKKAGYRLIANH